MSTYTAPQDVTITVSGASFDLEATLFVETKFKVLPGRAATLEEPAEPPQAETLSYVVTVKSDPGGIYTPAIMEAVTGEIEKSQDWLLAEAAELDAAAEDDRADALREERGAGISDG